MGVSYRPWLLILTLLGGCKSVVKVDVDCPRLCLAEPGQPLPGFRRFLPKGWDADVPSLGAFLPQLAATVDGGSALANNLMSGIADAYPGVAITLSPDTSAIAVDWTVEMDFDQILAEVPSSTINLAANVQIAAVQLTSTNDLSFLDSAEAFLRRRAKSSRGTRAADASPPTSANCAAATSEFPIARYDRAGVSSGAAPVDMIIANGDLNVFDCMKGAMTVFTLKLSIPAETYPAEDTPLTLGTCVSLQAHASYP